MAITLIRIELPSLRMQHAGVGNVDLRALSATRIHPISYPGVVGGRFRRVMSTEFLLQEGDVITLFSDGISSRLDLQELPRRDAQVLAETILQRHGKDHDDASCAVVLC